MDCIYAVTSRRGPQSGRWHRSYKIHSSIKYELHWDAVISRWAREHCERGRCLDVTKKKRYTQIYRSFYLLFIKFLFIFPAYKITTFPLTFQILPHNFYIHPLFFPLNQYSPTKKGGHPPFYHK